MAPGRKAKSKLSLLTRGVASASVPMSLPASDITPLTTVVTALAKTVRSLTATVADLREQLAVRDLQQPCFPDAVDMQTVDPKTGKLMPLMSEQEEQRAIATRHTARALAASLPRNRIPRASALEAAMIHAANNGKESAILDAWLMHEVGKDYK